MWKVLIIDRRGARTETVHEDKESADRHVKDRATLPTEVNPIFLRLEDADGNRFYVIDLDARASYENDNRTAEPVRTYDPAPARTDAERILRDCPLEKFFKSKLSKDDTQL